MKTVNDYLKRWLCVIFLFGLVTSLSAQIGAEDEGEIYEMSPFVVDSSDNVGYLATNTLAGTRLNTELKDVGSAISVVTAEFLQDTGATDTETLLVYTTNTEVAGVDGNFTHVGNGSTSNEEGNFLQPHNNTRVRGLTAADNTREYFVSDIPWEGFNVDRIDLQRGPNSILFGLGSPAGIINTDLKDADFAKDFGEVEMRWGRFDSYRGSLDINQILLDDELAVRVDALKKKQYFQQKPAYSEDERYYAALKYEPKFLKTDSARTTLKVKAESGEITSNRPRALTPGDQITPWFDEMGKLTIDPYDNQDNESKRPNTAWESDTYSDGTLNPYYSPYIGNWGQLYGGVLAIYENADSSTMSRYFSEPEHLQMHAPHGETVGGVSPALFRSIADYRTIARNLGLPYASFGQYKNKHLTDPSIFDFYHKHIDGDNKREWQEWDSMNINLSQGFFDEKVGIELVYDDQNYANEQLKLLGGERQTIYMDINANLPDGTPNPNVGRPFLSDSGRYGNNANETQRETMRASVYADLDVGDLMKKENLFTKIVGRHILSGVYTKNTVRQYREQFQRYATDADFGNLIGYTNYTTNDRQINTVHYLGDSLMNASSAAGANLPTLTAVQKPADGTVYLFNSHWNVTGVDYTAPWINPRTGLELTEADNPANYVGWTTAPFNVLDATNPDERAQTLTSAANIKDEVESKVFVWQSYWWDGAVVGTFGYRKDTAKNWSMSAPSYPDGTINLSDFKISGDPGAEQSGITRSYSGVIHINELIPNDRLPFNLSVFYNESENFQPAAGRVDVLNRPLPAPSGETKDYGFMISTKDNRYAARLNWYETTILNDSNDTVGATQWAIGIVENWAHYYAIRYRDDYGNDANFEPKDGMSPEATAALEAAAIEAWFANPPLEILRAWNTDLRDETAYTNYQTADAPIGMTATADTTSKGFEMELLANPTDGLRISFNASRTEATKNNVGGALAEYVDERLEYYRNTAAGEIRIWGPTGYGVIDRWADSGFLGDYELMKLTEGTATPELREWHFNAVANYSFLDGTLKGLNVGGGLRWQDEVIIGYPLTDVGDGVTFDIDNPYYGDARTDVDLWAGYERQLTEKIHWRIQLNVRNAFAQNELIPISTQPDGTPAAVRIAPGMTWEITNTFKF
jgi:outer membrane receptor protein involved in Fe transport